MATRISADGDIVRPRQRRLLLDDEDTYDAWQPTWKGGRLFLLPIYGLVYFSLLLFIFGNWPPGKAFTGTVCSVTHVGPSICKCLAASAKFSDSLLITTFKLLYDAFMSVLTGSEANLWLSWGLMWSGVKSVWHGGWLGFTCNKVWPMSALLSGSVSKIWSQCDASSLLTMFVLGFAYQALRFGFLYTSNRLSSDILTVSARGIVYLFEFRAILMFCVLLLHSFPNLL